MYSVKECYRMKLGDPAGCLIIDTCAFCGKPYNAKWIYGENNGKSKGYAVRLCCEGIEI